MKISLPGVLARAAERLQATRDAKHLAFPLRELLKHLRLVRKNPERIGEFLALWVDEGADKVGEP